ncbi:MAG: S-methyl-5'-thioadenosine phosphorylase [Chloroflexota bacterium]|nr:S-methyl-5'-thioadenosine phosphorylase [Chloroflexota bacterium]
MVRPMLGIIGGTGFYDMPGLAGHRAETIETPFGAPSGPVLLGALDGQPVAFLPRHGAGHAVNPTGLPYRANVYAMKAVGVTHLLSVSAVGSLREEIAPLHLVIPDQVIDRTTSRPRSFFDEGLVVHVGVAEPYCPALRQAVLGASGGLTTTTHPSGTYVCIEGPRFSTKAESALHRSWGASVVGMTAMPEVSLAREAELCYATVALVTDYDVWHESEEPVTVEVVGRTLRQNVESGRSLVRSLLAAGLPARDCACGDALTAAFSTDSAAVTDSARERYSLFLGDRLPRPEQSSQAGTD